MKMTTRHLGWLAAGGLLLLAFACSSPQPAATAPGEEPTAVPDIPATAAARAQTAPAGAPTATPVPPQVSRAALDFAVAHRAITQDWDQLHQDLDAWRQGLIACDASSVRVALHQFAGDFSNVTEAARGLPRSLVVRGLSDQLIQAAEEEEEALRLLRDTWQPGEGVAAAPVSGPPSNGGDGSSNGGEGSGDGPSEPGRQPVFEGVDAARSSASALQKQVADQLSDLQEKASSPAQAQVADFETAFRDLSTLWDRFHQDYDSFRAQEGLLASKETVERLGRLVDQFREVALAVRDLPVSPATSEVSKLLADAVQGEDLALRRLRGTFQKAEGEEAPAQVPGPPAEPPGPPEPEPAMSNPPAEGANSKAQENPAFVASDPTLFDAFDTRLVEANEARRQARQELAQVVEDISPESRAAVAEFASQYGRLLQQWQDFHREYGDWRRTEGGCDRARAVDALGGFTLRLGAVATSARGLPRATFLRPLGELMVEAAEREQDALGQLRDGWRPFDARVYQPLEQQRNTSGRLRRQVALGIQELLERYQLSLPAPE